ncbi:MAG: hypothetical protein JSU07_04355 [Bacteroidetes bacterium]|nr:hypothetical protein [Bacteroidota bacterium]
MKFLFVIFSVALFLPSKAQRKLKMELGFTYKQPYCGAAKPTVEQQLEAQRERPLDKQKFYVFKENICVDTIITNDSGLVRVKYLTGTYFLFEPWKVEKKTPDGSPMTDFFKACLEKEWKKPNYKLTVNNEDFKLEYYEISISRCSNQLACLKVRHLPKLIKRN